MTDKKLYDAIRGVPVSADKREARLRKQSSDCYKAASDKWKRRAEWLAGQLAQHTGLYDVDEWLRRAEEEA